MPLIRLLMLALLAWIVWRLYRVLIQSRRPRGGPAAAAEDMVQCKRCALHLPRSTAVRHEGDWFCCEAHRAEHLARKQRG